MKRIIWVILAIFFTFGPTEAHKRHGGRQFGLFYGSLASHGEWIEMSYGSVWRPHYTGHNWKPYSRGRWIWTDYGWYWNSYEPFGWATYHYGRWVYDDYYGWIWAPDDVWGPAWVEWRYDDDYIGISFHAASRARGIDDHCDAVGAELHRLGEAFEVAAGVGVHDPI